MKIFQLFRVNIPSEIFYKICDCFGFDGSQLNPEYSFCKNDLIKIDTLNNLLQYKDELCQYYIPCKAKLYLSNLNINKCITIFRQILRLNNMMLVSRQRYIKYKKTTFYSIKKEAVSEENVEIHSMKVNNNHLVLSFS
jgi:hypothetical protein